MEILYFLTAAFIVLAGLAVYSCARLTRERNYLRKRLADEKASGEILLKELHRVTKEDNETLKLFREDLAEFTVERDVAVARAGALERDKAEEVEIRVGLQNKVYGLEQEVARMRELLKQTDQERDEWKARIETYSRAEVTTASADTLTENSRLRTRVSELKMELLQVRDAASPKRAANGRFQKRAC